MLDYELINNKKDLLNWFRNYKEIKIYTILDIDVIYTKEYKMYHLKYLFKIIFIMSFYKFLGGPIAPTGKAQLVKHIS